MANTPLYPKTLIERGKWHDYRQGIWGDSFNWSWVRPWSQLTGILIHHTVTKHDATPDDIALLHKARGWAGIGYHFVITKDGIVHYCGDISTARAHVLNKNEKFIGITMVGDFTKHLPSDEQIRSAHDLCKFFLTETPSLPTLKDWSQVRGHKDEQATACPGTSWPNDMYDRIRDRRVYSPQPLPEPEPQPAPEPTPLPQPVPEQPVVINDPNAVIALGKIGDREYGNMKLSEIRTMIDGLDETKNNFNEITDIIKKMLGIK
jgi:hypothetical protein